VGVIGGEWRQISQGFVSINDRQLVISADSKLSRDISEIFESVVTFKTSNAGFV
jgi:hypothetical protein